jgi:hypothetical protein
MERKLRATSQSTDLASHEKFSAASTRASIELCEGKEFKRHPLPLAHPHPGSESGTFYFAKKRNFLLCVDIGKKITSASVEIRVNPRACCSFFPPVP